MHLLFLHISRDCAIKEHNFYVCLVFIILISVDLKKVLIFILCKYCNFFKTFFFFNLGSLVNRGQGNIRSSKTQDVSHIAFGSKILGPPPSSNRRVSTRVSGEVRKLKLQQNCWHFYQGRDWQAEESYWRFFQNWCEAVSGVLCLVVDPQCERYCNIQWRASKMFGWLQHDMGLFSPQKRSLRENLVAIFS